MGLVEEKAGELKDAIVNDEGYQKDDLVDVVFFDSLLW